MFFRVYTLPSAQCSDNQGSEQSFVGGQYTYNTRIKQSSILVYFRLSQTKLDHLTATQKQHKRNIMLCILISCVSFIIIFSKSFSKYKPEFPAEDREMISSSCWLMWKTSYLLNYWFSKSRHLICLFGSYVTMPLKKNLGPKVENGGGEGRFSLLDLPELPLECILEHLSPAGLCTMSAVCTYLRDKCRSDHLWEKHLQEKWGQLIGDAAYRQWESNKASRGKEKFSDQYYQKGLLLSLVGVWPFCWNRLKSEEDSRLLKSSIPDDTVKALYLSLERGKVSFPAQVFNRENGHAGFLLSCYDAQLTYDSRTDTFLARYSPHGGWATEENIQWNRLRRPPMDHSPHDLYTSDCLYDLKPGDCIEIQWRKSKEFPFGWWYGVVGHLDTCLGDQNQCYCRFNDTLILEFNQYKPGSCWRQAKINKRDHREHGNGSDGFYGGIRKLESKQEMDRWKTFLQVAGF